MFSVPRLGVNIERMWIDEMGQIKTGLVLACGEHTHRSEITSDPVLSPYPLTGHQGEKEGWRE